MERFAPAKRLLDRNGLTHLTGPERRAVEAGEIVLKHEGRTETAHTACGRLLWVRTWDAEGFSATRFN